MLLNDFLTQIYILQSIIDVRVVFVVYAVFCPEISDFLLTDGCALSIQLSRRHLVSKTFVEKWLF